MSKCYICGQCDARIIGYNEIFPQIDYEMIGNMCFSCQQYLGETLGFIYQKAKKRYFTSEQIKSVILQLKKRDEFVPELPE